VSVYQRIVAHLTKKQGYVRCLYNLDPSLIKLRPGGSLPGEPVYDQLTSNGPKQPDDIEHVVSVASLMDACVMDRFDLIAFMFPHLGPVELLAMLEGL